MNTDDGFVLHVEEAGAGQPVVFVHEFAGDSRRRTIPASGLAILPKTGHTLNLEEPALFNQPCGEFFHQVEARRGRSRAQAPAAATSKIQVIDP